LIKEVMMKRINIVSFEPLYFVTLGFALCLFGILLNKSTEIHDVSIALVSGGMGAYSIALTSPKISPIDAINSIDSIGNNQNKNNNDNPELIANNNNQDYSEHK
jgi:hypothetical protein